MRSRTALSRTILRTSCRRRRGRRSSACALLAASAFAVVGVFMIGFGFWATYAPLESAAIAGGAIEAESSRKTIQHLEGGIIGAHPGEATATR